MNYSHKINSDSEIISANKALTIKPSNNKSKLIYYGFDHNHDLADIFSNLKNDIGLEHLSFYILDTVSNEKIFFSSDIEWSEYYLKHGLYNKDFLWHHGFNMLNRAARSKHMKPSVVECWNNVLPTTPEQKDIEVERIIKGGFHNGLGHIQKVGNLIMTCSFAGKPKDTDFHKKISSDILYNTEMSLINEILVKGRCR